MYEPISKAWHFGSILLWVDLALSIILITFLLIVASKTIKRVSFTIATLSIGLGSIIAWFFGLRLLWALLLVIMASYFCVILIQNQNDLKELFGSPFHKKQTKNAQKVYDRHAVCQKVAIAVETLSRSKTGALITFEKNISLGEVCKTGTFLNAPVTPELLVTIFYPGTRLHDGAVVIRRDQILAASVYYTPTTKPLTGKFGSRHRAAIGISEFTDSVTVIVSEETGRVSLAYHGELISVAPDSFLRTIEEYLFSEEKNEKEEK